MSSNFIISPYAISFESIRNQLEQYVANKPENETWKDFYASGAGQTVIELASALGAFYAYHFIMGRRESFLATAQNYSSIIGLAENLGYSTSRGTNLQVNVNIVPNQTITLSKWDIIGSYAEYDIVLLEDVVLNRGIATNVPIIIGNLMNESITVNTSKLNQFSFSNPNVTDTYKILLNNEEVPFTNSIKEALDDKYVAISNSLGSVDVFYLQQGNYKYKPSDILTLAFIERNSLTFEVFANSNLNIDYATSINESKLIQNRIDKEEIDNIKIKAPLYHETSVIIRSRKDYSKYLLLKNPSIIAANDEDIYPGLIAITYIKEDGTNLSEKEKNDWLNQIEEARPSGVAKAIIVDSQAINKTLAISLWRKSGYSIGDSVSEAINKIFKNYEKVFDKNLDLDQLEHDIEEIDEIKIARVELSYDSWDKNTFFGLYNLIKVGNDSFYARDFIYKTGNTEPQWPTKFEETIIDGDVIWKKVNDFQGMVINKWLSNSRTTLYDYIKVESEDKVDIFVCCGYANRSGDIEPEWGEEFVNDNKLVWQKFELKKEKITEDDKDNNENDNDNDTVDIYDNSWSANTIYQLSDFIKTSSGYYKVVSFRGLSGSEIPDWSKMESGEIIDGDIIWNPINTSSRTITLNWNQYFKLDKTLTIIG